MNKDLIYDVGMNNGDDTAYYLERGYRVVAIEADPVLVDACTKRFASAVAKGRLSILNVAIAENEGVLEFWRNNTAPHLSSFSRASAESLGGDVEGIFVNCVRLDAVIQEHGIPYYLKIDIEGHDIVCCRQLSAATTPPFISVEMSDMALLEQLRTLGFDRFQLVDQRTLQGVGRKDISLRERTADFFFRLANYRTQDRNPGLKAIRRLASVGATLKKVGSRYVSSASPDWVFPEGSSGVFAHDLPGDWLGWQDVARIYQRDLTRYQKMNLAHWCDLHATTSNALENRT